ncbi:hypothetical protein XF_1839 [Xylella fastidiosa 9a5c]|uniref:Uncharacterized protein n=1 Tax=Xylella fastidiosa (strain 9a5c) TaxID=160492 RepID=Q9PCE2_XYLFA|nr:hypothetical protein XF_1839 [Xylella fastidiosa 9a5c]
MYGLLETQAWQVRGHTSGIVITQMNQKNERCSSPTKNLSSTLALSNSEVGATSGAKARMATSDNSPVECGTPSNQLLASAQ